MERLTQWVRGDELLQLRHQRSSRGHVRHGEIGRHPGLQRGKAQLFQAGRRHPRERQVRRVGERRTAPERQGGPQDRGGTPGITLGPARAHQVLELRRVHRLRRDVEQVTGRMRHHGAP
ncbi:hypothetical protein GCM10027612_47810 [Microbispora bryophytorum subsp. camponoti]